MLINPKIIRHLNIIFWAFVLFSTFAPILASDRTPIDQLTKNDLERKVNQALELFQKNKLHESFVREKTRITPGSPSHGLLISYRPETEAMDVGRKGMLAGKVTNILISNHCYNRITNEDNCAKISAQYNLSTTSLQSACDEISPECSYKEMFTPYRNINGQCNHFKSLGKSFTAYQRLLPAAYSNNIDLPKRAQSKKQLPNARDVTSALIKFDDVRHDRLSVAVLQWGQFFEQDLSRPASSMMYHFDNVFRCCEDNGDVLMPRYKHTACFPITISNDLYYKRSFKHCMSYVRSLTATNQDCQLGPINQINQATAFLDGSQIYGVSDNLGNALRDTNGDLKKSTLHGNDYLPLSSNPKEHCLYTNEESLCFKSGDPRVNFEPQSVVMHTVWNREHNRIVKELRELNGDKMNDEQRFQEARKIVIAEIQHITYNEWAKEILDEKYLKELSKFSTYNPEINPAVVNSVAIALFGAFKSLYPSKLSLFSENRNTEETIDLKNHYYKPEIFKDYLMFDKLIRGIVTQKIGRVDKHYAEDLVNHLFTNGDMGYDTLAIDIQRGRDHGLPSYNTMRQYIGFKAGESFRDFGDVMAKEDYVALSKVYEHPNDVDLIVGGLLEKPVSNSLLGPTFSWLLTNQLWRTRRGDRFFYTHDFGAHRFTDMQLSEIQKVSLARIFCDNSDNINAMQLNVFEIISEKNPLVSCSNSDIPRMNFSAWTLVSS